MSFEIDDGGRSLSKRPGQTNDCVIRAIAIALERDYDEIYDVMKDLGRKCHAGTMNRVWTAWLLAEGAEKVEFDEEEGMPTLRQFISEWDGSRFVVHIPGHAVAVVDGVIHDTAHFSLRTKIKGAFEWPV